MTLQNTVKEIDLARIKEEKARQRALEAEKRKEKEEERKKEREERAKQAKENRPQPKKGGKEEGVMDSAMARLRGGEAFVDKRKERKTSKLTCHF